MNRTAEAWNLAGLCLTLALGLMAPPVRAQIENEWPELEVSLPAPVPWLLKVKPPAIASGPRFVRSLRVVVNPALLVSGAERFRIPLPDGSSVTAVREREESRADGFVWFGGIEGEPGSDVIISVVGETMVGSVRSFWHHTLLIEPGRGPFHWLHEVNRRFVTREARHQSKVVLGPPVCASCSDPEGIVDVMVVYTNDARRYTDDEGAVDDFTPEEMEAKVYLMVAEANESFVNSEITLHLELVHVGPVAMAGTGFLVDDVATGVIGDHTRLKGDAEVLSLREEFGADLVVLVVGTGSDSNGYADMPSPATAADCNLAFAVVERSSAESSLTFIHEIGHLFGANHNCADKNLIAVEKTGVNHGYDQEFPDCDMDLNYDGPVGWCTVMSVRNDPDTAVDPDGIPDNNVVFDRIAFWSNPNVFYPDPDPGDPEATNTDPPCSDTTGDDTPTCGAFDASTLIAAADVVANYRCSSPGRADVWMKDTWKDTGVEPNPTSEFMSRSPYIWVRTERDSQFLHQHEHQNPIRGRSNWIYVKLHNGSDDPAHGILRTYWADANTSIEWESGWHLIDPIDVDSAAVGGFPGSSSLIVEQPWVPEPGSTHFCLLARWDSVGDEMHWTEGQYISTIVRNNNNLIWKNLTIVDLFNAPMTAASFILDNGPGPPPGPGPGPGPGPDPEHEHEPMPGPVPDPQRHDEVRTSLTIRPAGADPRSSFIRNGRVRLYFPPELMEAWMEGGQKGQGFKAEKHVRIDGELPVDSFLLTEATGATFDFRLSPRAAPTVEVEFERTVFTPRRDFLLDFEHRIEGELVGGVSFEVQCSKHPR